MVSLVPFRAQRSISPHCGRGCRAHDRFVGPRKVGCNSVDVSSSFIPLKKNTWVNVADASSVSRMRCFNSSDSACPSTFTGSLSLRSTSLVIGRRIDIDGNGLAWLVAVERSKISAVDAYLAPKFSVRFLLPMPHASVQKNYHGYFETIFV
jgi:hypothetical protein